MTYSFSDEVVKLNPELTKELKSQPASKYRNVRAEARGMTFASGHEASVIAGLILMEEQKKIFGLRLQVRFPLQGNVTCVSDAVYLDDKLNIHIIDCKAFDVKTQKFILTKEFKIKAKLFKSKYGREIELL